jgi:hypothetical protein
MKKHFIKLTYVLGFFLLLPSIAWAHSDITIVSYFILVIAAQLFMLGYVLVSAKVNEVRIHALAIYCTTLFTSWIWFLTGRGALYSAIGVLLIPPALSFVFTITLINKMRRK